MTDRRPSVPAPWHALVLALLLALAPLAVGAVPAAPATSEPAALPTAAESTERTLQRPVVSAEGTSEYLALKTTRASGVARPGLDVAGTLAAETAEVESGYLRYRLDRRFRTGNESVQRTALRETADEVGRRIARLRTRERRTVAAYADGKIDERESLRRLGTIDRRADALAEVVSRLAFINGVADDPVSPRRLARFKVRLLAVEGPVRNDVAEALAGQRRTPRVHVAGSDDGVVLAAVRNPDSVNPQFVREAYDASARDPDAPNQFAESDESDLTAAENRARGLYSWVFENRLGFSFGIVGGTPPLTEAATYPLAVDHVQGTASEGDLVAYIDGGTTDVYRELQYKSLPAVPTDRHGTGTADGLRLTVDTTRQGGPALATVTADGKPVDATLSVGNETLGSTGSDGQRWFVTGRGETPLTATAGGKNVSVVVNPPAEG